MCCTHKCIAAINIQKSLVDALNHFDIMKVFTCLYSRQFIQLNCCDCCLGQHQCIFFLLTGTTWMQEIVSLISNKGDPHLSQNVPNWTRSPWLEQYYFAAVLESSPSTPRVITTHLPHHLLGPALQGSRAKVRFT